MSGSGPGRRGGAWLRSPLRLRLLAAIALMTGLQVGAVWAFWWPLSRDAAQEHSIAQTTAHLQTLGDSLVPYLIQNQMAAVYENLDALGERHPAWLSLRLTSPEGMQLYPLQSVALSSAPDRVLLQHPIVFDTVAYGDLELLCDLGEITRSSIQSARLISEILTVVSLLFGLFLGALVELLVVRPVRALQEAAGSLAQGDYDTQLPVPYKDEVGELVTNFSLMRSALARQQRELEQAMEDAQQANKAKGRFLAAMSHEIRTPLHGIIALAELLDAPDLTGVQSERLHTLQGSANHLLRLLNDILDFSRLEEGQYRLVSEPFSLSDLLDEIVMLVRPLARSQGLQFELDSLAPQNCSVLGDRGRLAQVLLNLCSNAVKYTDEGHVVLRVRSEKHGSEVQFTFEVEDTGIGISSADLERVFQRFVRAPGGEARVGTGLGLAISQEVVSLMGGHIDARSTLGTGSCFTVSLRLPIVNMTSTTPLPTELPPPMRILVVDDHPVNRMVAQQLLRRDGHEVLVASNGMEALHTCEKEPLDLVLMDIQMPELDGLQTTALIRALPGPMHHVPIVAFTASAFPEDLERYRKAGMDDCLSKPLVLDVLRRKFLMLHRTRAQHRSRRRA